MQPLRPRGSRNGGGRPWRRVRAYVLQRDGWACRLELDGCTHRADTAHHVLGWAYGDAPEDAVTGRHLVVAACSSCNLKVGEPHREDPACRPRTAW